MDTRTDHLNDANNNLKINGNSKELNSGITIGDLSDQNEDKKLLWNPKKSAISQSTKLVEFQNLIEKKYGLNFKSYNDLYKWSCENFIIFWEEFWYFSNIVYSKSYDKVLDKPDGPVDNLPFSWFDGARLNYAENLLRYNDEKVAVYSYGEAFAKVKTITFRELRDKVRIIQNCLTSYGIQKNDVVVGYLPNFIEALAVKLSVVSLGAVWSCASPDFGANSVVERFKQINPKLIFSVTSVYYNGKKHDHVSKLKDALNAIESLKKHNGVDSILINLI